MKKLFIFILLIFLTTTYVFAEDSQNTFPIDTYSAYTDDEIRAMYLAHVRIIEDTNNYFFYYGYTYNYPFRGSVYTAYNPITFEEQFKIEEGTRALSDLFMAYVDNADYTLKATRDYTSILNSDYWLYSDFLLSYSKKDAIEWLRKELIVYDFFKDLNSFVYTDDYSNMDYFTPYGLLFLGKGSCAARTLTLKYFLDELGFENKLVIYYDRQNGVAHAYNLFYKQSTNEYVYLDSTLRIATSYTYFNNSYILSMSDHALILSKMKEKDALYRFNRLKDIKNYVFTLD